jgi:chemotaxis protein CheD
MQYTDHHCHSRCISQGKLTMKGRAIPVAKRAAAHTKTVELMPGDVAIGLAGDQLKTLLGSCVSVILTDPRRTVAAMCHIVHAGQPKVANAGNTAYAIVAMGDMFDRLTTVGVIPTRCEAYVFGGGNMFPALFAKQHVGDNNVEWVLDYLHGQGIPVVDHCLGGAGYRKISWTVGPTEPLVETVFPEHGHSDDR